MYLLTGNMSEVSNLRHTEAGGVVLGSEQVGDFLPPAFGHLLQGAFPGYDHARIKLDHHSPPSVRSTNSENARSRQAIRASVDWSITSPAHNVSKSASTSAMLGASGHQE